MYRRCRPIVSFGESFPMPSSPQRPSGLSPERPILLVAIAAPAEIRVVRAGLAARSEVQLGQLVLLPTGVGKSPAAARTALAVRRYRPLYLLNVGVAGLLPPAQETAAEIARTNIGDAVLATASIFADEGLRTADGFIGCDEMGFPPVPGDGPHGGLAVPSDPHLAALLAPVADRTGPIATVSACSGTDANARELADRTAAAAEAMEGAAVGLAARLASEPDPAAGDDGFPPPAFAELRVISNTTGDRDRQRWDLAGALDRLGAIAADAASRILSNAPAGDTD